MAIYFIPSSIAGDKGVDNTYNVAKVTTHNMVVLTAWQRAITPRGSCT